MSVEKDTEADFTSKKESYPLCMYMYYTLTSDARDKANIQSLPNDVLEKIFSYLPMEDTFSVCLVCKQWNTIIMYTESIWKMRCHTQPVSVQRRIMDDKAQGHNWKETFKMNYGKNGIKRMWEFGLFSNPASYDDLPEGMFSNMDPDSWGDVFQMELDRA